MTPLRSRQTASRCANNDAKNDRRCRGGAITHNDGRSWTIAVERGPRGVASARFCIPNRSTKSSERKREQKKRWFRNGQKWRSGCEGRISVLKRRNGLDRCRYKGESGMQRWVGLGVIADNLVNISLALQKKSAP